MNKHYFFGMFTALASLTSLGMLSSTTAAKEPLHFLHHFRWPALGIPRSVDCNACGHPHAHGAACVVLASVDDQVIGKKRVDDSSIRYEWATVPETQYRWKKRLVTKEISCEYCKPFCETTQAEQVVVREKWQQEDFPGGEIHCRVQDLQQEAIPVTQCKHEPGETTIKVRFWTTVKEPFTVYRQVKRPVCVKQTRREPATVTVTRQIPVPW